MGESLQFHGRIEAQSIHPAALEHYAEIFRTIGLPPIHRDYQKDEVFAEMRMAGFNPVMLQRVSALDDRFPVTEADFQSVLPGDSLARAGAEGRLFLVDFKALENVENGVFPSGQKYIYAPLALFATELVSRKLVPVAIQCKQEPAPGNPIFTPDDGINWLIAKTIVSIADANVHEAVSHLARTHLFIEPFVVSTYRQLAANHPLFLLLVPHFENTLAINRESWRHLIADRGAVDKMFGGTIQSTRRLVVAGVQSQVFKEALLPVSLKSRGVDDHQILPHYPYRDDAMLLWEAIHQWVVDYLGLYYKDDSEVAGDFELAAWSTEIVASEGGRLKGLGEDGRIKTFGDLADAATLIIFTSSVQHAAVNFPQYDLMSYAPNAPLAAYAPAPTQKKGATIDDYLGILPPSDLAELQMELGYMLGSVRYTSLGHYRDEHFEDRRVQAPLRPIPDPAGGNRGDHRRTEQTRRPYKFLAPSLVPQSINI